MGKGKRVSNKRGDQPDAARSGRVRLGFYRQRKIARVQGELDRRRNKPMDKEGKIAYNALNKVLMNLMPKRRERRTQVRGK